MARVTIHVGGVRGANVGDTIDVIDSEAEWLVAYGYAKWPDDDDTTSSEQPTPGQPNASSPKDEWVAHAETLDIDTDGMTKAEVQAAVAAHEQG